MDTGAGVLRALSMNFNEGDFREALGINRVNDALVDVGPSLLLATMRTDSDMITTRIATEDLSVDDNIVLLMGPPGSGKTTFIEIAGGTRGIVNHQNTTDISAFKVSVSNFRDSNIVLVDVPTFNDTDKPDIEILQTISDWLNQTYKRGIQLCGLIYFHRISDEKMEGNPLRNWRAFEKICGEGFNKVVLTTTMWDNVEEHVGYDREQELEDFWSVNIVRGAAMRRFLRSRPSAADVLSSILENISRRPLRLQKEITDLDMSLRQTSAARALFSQLEALLRDSKHNLIRIRDDLRNPSLNKQELRDLEQKYNKTSFLQRRVMGGLTDLRIAPAERLQRFMLMTPGLHPVLKFLGFRRRSDSEDSNIMIMDAPLETDRTESPQLEPSEDKRNPLTKKRTRLAKRLRG